VAVWGWGGAAEGGRDDFFIVIIIIIEIKKIIKVWITCHSRSPSDPSGNFDQYAKHSGIRGKKKNIVVF